MSNSKERQRTEEHGKDYHGAAANRILHRKTVQKARFFHISRNRRRRTMEGTVPIRKLKRLSPNCTVCTALKPC